MNSLIELSGVYKQYGEGDGRTVALSGIDCQIKTGEFVAIVGPSGSGKSTLMHLIGLLDTPTKGRYIFEDKDVANLHDNQLARLRRNKIGFVFQSFNLLARHSALENVMLPLLYTNVTPQAREHQALKLLDQVGLTQWADHHPNELSGGQMQRVAIARALANNPSLILADEPTGNLDSKTGQTILDLLKKLHNSGNTIILVSHDPKIAEAAERVLQMKDGKIENDSAAENPDLSASHLSESGDEKMEDGNDDQNDTQTDEDEAGSEEADDDEVEADGNTDDDFYEDESEDDELDEVETNDDDTAKKDEKDKKK